VITTHDFVVIWECATIAVTLAVLWFIVFRAAPERRPLYWAIFLAWLLAGYIWDVNINFVGHVEYSDHWWMMYRVNGKAEPAIAPFIYIFWEVVPALVALHYRELLNRALGRHAIWWILLGFLLWSFYLDFASTSWHPVWAYYQRWPYKLEYPLTAPFVNDFLCTGAFFVFRKLDDLRQRGVQLRFRELAVRSALATNVTCAILLVSIVVLKQLPLLDRIPIPYVKSQY